MSWLRHVATVATAAAGTAWLSAAPPRPIGIAASELGFAAGASAVRGQATLFEGDPVRSEFLPTRMHLKDGSRYVLGIASDGTIYQDHLLLRSGSAEVLSSGRPSRVVASSIAVSAETAGTAATVYAGKDSVTVQVRSGEVKVGKVGSARLTVVPAGRAVTFQPGVRDNLTSDPDRAVVEAARIQSGQIVRLAEATRNYNCLEPKVDALASRYSSLASRIAVTQAARSVIQQRLDSGAAGPEDLRQLSSLNNDLRSLQQGSAALAEDLGGVILQHHPGPAPTSASSHSVHDHTGPEHHGEHGHVAPPPLGHHLPFHPPPEIIPD